jgi:predicted phage-related endonuclease
MKIHNMKQLSPEWWKLKVGKISGTRFGQIISNRKNRLVYELTKEILDGYIEQDEFMSDEMLYGIDNEDLALDLYSENTGNAVDRIGAITADWCGISMASPDGVTLSSGVVQEVKCTMNGAIHLQRYFEGPETQYMAQIKNYFVVDDSIKRVDFISYCGNRPEKPFIVIPFYRKDFEREIGKWREKIILTELTVQNMIEQFVF